MTQMKLARGSLNAPSLVLGCLRMNTLSTREATALVQTAVEKGVTHFDHADVYGDGRSEEVFGKVMEKHPGLRDQILLQSKCGIRKGYYDFSKEYLLTSVEESLQRLKTDYLDILLLHRPDTLMEPAEVAEAFSQLHESGKVRYFGVSNHHPLQIEVLNQQLEQPLILNQLQLSLANTSLLDAGLHVNMNQTAALNRDGYVLDYCRTKGMTLQAWSPLTINPEAGSFIGHGDYLELNRLLERMAESKNTQPSAIALAWIMRHPAGIQPVVGTTRPERLEALSEAAHISLNRQEWYALYLAAGNRLP
ncbi:aldo/keto reductase [Anoxynatronum sibiricum]|uniref:Aldo/keto reductase n=1 Tax=Anoxynatronum sibiricum TaxID=210623 RepID=A0ABU9VTM6_9CLOT